jgi:DNA primase
VNLRRSGKNYTGFCPFHSNTRTPAFVVFSDSGTWRCFGQCNEGGDIFKFVMKRDGVDFPEALRTLAEKAGVQLKPQTPQEEAAAEEHDHLRQLLEEAVNFYRHHLFNTPAGKIALDYLTTKRKLTHETIEGFGLGYAPQGWDAVMNHFRGKGVSEKDLLEAGLLTEREATDERRASLYDRFRHRIMIPIRDERGRMAGFGARILNPDDQPKFLNSPQTPIFDKGRLLYGLDRARKPIRERDQAVIVEGYLDVIALHQAGFANAVSPMGTALTEHQMYLLKRFSRRIVLALDPDAAGDKATLRGLEIARQAMDRSAEPVFDARGLLGYEARLQADLRIAALPEGLDPDEVVARDPQEWERILADARPVVVHVMETLAAGRNLDDPKIKKEISARVLPLIEDVPDPVERDAYRQRLARLLRVDERAMQQAVVQRPRPRQRPTQPLPQPADPTRTDAPPTAKPSPPAAGYALEAHCLGVLLRRPDLLYQVDRRLQSDGLARLSLDDFQHTDHQAMFEVLTESIEQDVAEPLNFAMTSFSLPLMDLADGLLERTTRLDPNEDRVLEDLMRGLLDLRLRHLHDNIDYLRGLIQDAQDGGDPRATQYAQEMNRFMRARLLLDSAYRRYTSRMAAKPQGG